MSWRRFPTVFAAVVAGLACGDGAPGPGDAGPPRVMLRPDGGAGGDGDDCAGDQPRCFERVAIGGPICCGEIRGTAECVFRGWTCPPGEVRGSECARFASAGECGPE